MKHYILRDKEVVETSDSKEWATFMAHGNRVLEKTVVDEVLISTIFTGVDHAPNLVKYLISDCDGLFFETAIIGGRLDGVRYRYESWIEALDGHQEVVNLVKEEVVGVKETKSVPEERWKILSKTRFLRPL